MASDKLSHFISKNCRCSQLYVTHVGPMCVDGYVYAICMYTEYTCTRNLLHLLFFPDLLGLALSFSYISVYGPGLDCGLAWLLAGPGLSLIRSGVPLSSSANEQKKNPTE